MKRFARIRGVEERLEQDQGMGQRSRLPVSNSQGRSLKSETASKVIGF